MVRRRTADGKEIDRFVIMNPNVHRRSKSVPLGRSNNEDSHVLGPMF